MTTKPTSFSQVRVAVLCANRGRWSASERRDDAPTMNGVEAWVHAFGGDYFFWGDVKAADIADYDIVIANANFGTSSIFNQHKNWLPKLIQLAETRNSTTKWVTLMEGGGNDYLRPKPYLRAALDCADLVNCINIHTLSFLRSLTSAKVEYIGIPYPVEGISAKKTPIEQRTKQICICPMLMNRWNDYTTAKQIGLPYYGFSQSLVRRIPRISYNWKTFRSIFDKEKPKNIIRGLFDDPNLDIRFEATLPTIMQMNGSAWFWLNLDDRYTWGRYVLDAAALGVPIITTKSTGHAELLFPETTLDHEFEIDKAVEIGRRLANDFDFYKAVAQFPEGKMEDFKPPAMVKKLLSALDLA